MQKEFTENWNTFCQCVSKPLIDMTQLNITTLNNIAKNTSSLEELTQTKKPEDFISAQAKIANATCLEAARYSQKAMEIGLNAVSNLNKAYMDCFNNAAAKATDSFKNSAASKTTDNFKPVNTPKNKE